MIIVSHVYAENDFLSTGHLRWTAVTSWSAQLRLFCYVKVCRMYIAYIIACCIGIIDRVLKTMVEIIDVCVRGRIVAMVQSAYATGGEMRDGALLFDPVWKNNGRPHRVSYL